MKLNKRKSIVKDTLSADGYNNFAAKLGMQTNNLAAKGTYTYGKVISRQRALLEIIYRTSWVAGQVVDTIAEDMTKEGINMFSEMAPDDIQSMQSALTELNIFGAICENIKWARLYGGSIAVILIEGADYSKPLNIERIGKNQFKGLVVFDRWQIEPSLSDLITEIGPDMGLPKYYTILPSMETLSGEKIHYSRVIRMDGIKMPYYQRRTDNFWGMSIVERLYDRLIAFDSGTAGAAQMLYKAYLRVVQIDGLRAALAIGGKQEQAVIKQFQYIQMLQSQEGITLLDSKDQFSTHQYQFSGVSDVLIQLGQQISGATNIPLVRLFGQSPAGFSTGDTDLRNYYDHIGKLQENVLRMPVRKILEILSRSLLGKNLPDDFEFEFSSLWEMSEVEKSQIASSDSSTISNYFQSGIITKRIALKELLQQSRTTGRFTNISKEDIENALEEPPEHQGMEMGGENEDNTQSLVKPGKQELDLSNLEKALNDLNTPEQDNRPFNAEGILENLEKELQSLDMKTLEQLEIELNTIINGGKTLESLEAELKTLGLSDNTIKLLSQQLEEIKLSAPKKKMPVTDRGMSFEMAVRNSFGITEDARARAPKGGITIKGKEFTGGEFIPTEGGYAEAFEKMKKEKKASAKAEKGSGYAAEYKKQQKKKPEPEKESSKGTRLDKAKLATLKTNLSTPRRAHVEKIINASPSQREKLAIKDIQQTAMVDEKFAQTIYDNVRLYSDGGYKTIRANPKSDEAKVIEEFIEKSPKWDNSKPLVRGLNVDKSFISKLKSGKSINMQGLSSWSSDANIAVKFTELEYAQGFTGFDDAKRRKVILRLSHANKAVAISHLSEAPHEQEVLLSSKAKLVVESYKKSGDYFIVDLKEVASKAKDRAFDSVNILVIDEKTIGKQISLLAKWGSDSSLIKIEDEIKTQDAERLRAPKGGVSIKGKEFQGGEFIPTEGGYAEAFEKMKKEKKASAKAEKGKGPEKQDKKKNDKKEIIAALKAKLKQQSAKEGTKRTVKTAAYNYAKRDKDGKIVMGDGKGIPSHLKGVAIPPAWKNFLISPSGKDKCWLIAFDENGKRLGGIYSPKHVEGRDFKKDAMLNDLNKNLDVIQKQLDEDQRKEESFQKAFITKLLAITGARVGSNEKSMSAKGKTYGVSTLEGRHIVEQEDGSVQLNFVGKRGKENIYIVKDKQAIKKLLELKKKAGDKGRLFDEKYNDLLGYVKELDGGGFTPHNFRTKIATDTAMELISKAPAPSNLKEYKKAVKEIAKAVGNRICDTPATALKSYIVTSVFTDWKIKAGIE